MLSPVSIENPPIPHHHLVPALCHENVHSVKLMVAVEEMIAVGCIVVGCIVAGCIVAVKPGTLMVAEELK